MNDWMIGIVIYLVIGILIVGLPEVINHTSFEIFQWADWQDYVAVVTLFVLGTILWPANWAAVLPGGVGVVRP